MRGFPGLQRTYDVAQSMRRLRSQVPRSRWKREWQSATAAGSINKWQGILLRVRYITVYATELLLDVGRVEGSTVY
jgi:hypothetical protein